MHDVCFCVRIGISLLEYFETIHGTLSDLNNITMNLEQSLSVLPVDGQAVKLDFRSGKFHFKSRNLQLVILRIDSQQRLTFIDMVPRVERFGFEDNFAADSC